MRTSFPLPLVPPSDQSKQDLPTFLFARSLLLLLLLTFRLVLLDEAVLLQLSGQQSLQQITVTMLTLPAMHRMPLLVSPQTLNLSGNRLTRFRVGSSLSLLSSLSLSRNELTTAEGLAHMVHVYTI